MYEANICICRMKRKKAHRRRKEEIDVPGEYAGLYTLGPKRVAHTHIGDVEKQCGRHRINNKSQASARKKVYKYLNNQRLHNILNRTVVARC